MKNHITELLQKSLITLFEKQIIPEDCKTIAIQVEANRDSGRGNSQAIWR